MYLAIPLSNQSLNDFDAVRSLPNRFHKAGHQLLDRAEVDEGDGERAKVLAQRPGGDHQVGDSRIIQFSVYQPKDNDVTPEN